MKLDGHARLTNRAIQTFKMRCSKATDIFLKEKICQLPQFSTFNIDWQDWKGSNDVDNSNLVNFIIAQELSIFGESFHKLERGYLTREVVAVDLEPFKLRYHFLNSGQKYHFMRRATGATIKEAHKECIEFIYTEATNWVKKMNHVLYSFQRHGRSTGSTIFLRKQAVSHLALSLHSLQDSFSPGHTKRTTYQNYLYPGAIENIFIYKNQNKDVHSHGDYASGSVSSLHARSAVYASAELMQLCAHTVSMKAMYPIGWDAFQNRWLKLSSRAKL